MTRPPHLLTVLLVSYNTKHLLDRCLSDLQAAMAPMGGAQVIVVDNDSRDGSAEHLQTHHPDVHLIRSGANLGFGRANNLALSQVRSPYLLLLNTDAFVQPEALTRTLAYMDAHARCGILGARLVGRDGALQPSCRYFPTPLNMFLVRFGLAKLMPSVTLIDDMSWDHQVARACDWVPGCFYLVRKDVIDQVGLFDPRYFLYFEEVDHCRAAKLAGWEVHFFADTTVVHIGGESARSDGPVSQAGQQVEALQLESAMLYFRKNGGLLTLGAHLLLELLGDAMLAAKALAKAERRPRLGYHVKRIQATLRLALQTRLGLQPTR